MIKKSFIIVVVFAAFFTGIFLGEMVKQHEIEQRALNYEEKLTYSWQDIEIIIFNEIQE